MAFGALVFFGEFYIKHLAVELNMFYQDVLLYAYYMIKTSSCLCISDNFLKNIVYDFSLVLSCRTDS